MNYTNPAHVNALVLAYLGDAYFELLVRDYLIKKTTISKPNDFQKVAIKLVSATSHELFIKEAMSKLWLSDEEIVIYKRGRNTKGNTKNETSAHRHSTGFEAIIGQYYLEENFDRINELFDMFIGYFSETIVEL